jgi:AraC family transcriptional regulator
MDHTIVEKPSFNVVGKAKRVPTKNGENMRIIPQFWAETTANGTFDRVLALPGRGNVLGDVTLGVCTDFAPDMSEFTYIIAAESTAPAQDGFTQVTVPALTWAVFDGVGPISESIGQIWGHIMGEFFPAGGYQHGPGPDLEVYPPGNPMQAGYQYQIWVPVVKK